MVHIKIYIDNIDISYNVYGEGKPIILLHGWGANKNTFNRLAEELKENYKVYVLDLPGFGESEIGLPLNLYEVVEIIHKFTLDLSIHNPIILGHSYGGRLAIIYASKYNVDKLVLVSAAGIKNKLKISKKLKVKLYKSLRKIGINMKMGSKDYRDCDNVKRTMLVNAVNTDLRNEMKLITVPTLLIYGDEDTTTPLDIGYKIRDMIKGSTIIVMNECQHFPYLEKPTIFNMILNSFLLA